MHNLALPVEEVRRRFAIARGELVGEYKNLQTKVAVRCIDHDVVTHVLPSNVFRGQRLYCCGNASRSVKHTGKVVSEETKNKLRKISGPLHSHFGVPLPEGVAAKVSTTLRERAAASIDYAIMKAATGKTSGKPGHFYIARLESNCLLKFGSVVRMTPRQRLGLLRDRFGYGTELALVAAVPDAGAYEAEMMRRCRVYWHHGEYFCDFTNHSEVSLAA